MATVDVVATKQDERAELLADGCITVLEAAKFSGLGKSTLYELMDAGRLAYVRVGRARRIPKRELLRFLAGQLVPRRTA